MKRPPMREAGGDGEDVATELALGPAAPATRTVDPVDVDAAETVLDAPDRLLLQSQFDDRPVRVELKATRDRIEPDPIR